MDAVLTPRLVISDGPRIGVKLLRLNNRSLKLAATKRKFNLARMSFDADTPTIGSLEKNHAAGVIPQRGHYT
jgi:hypothetical protein